MIPSPPPPLPRAVETPLRPRALRPGGRVALVAPAGPVTPERAARAEARVRELGFTPRLDPGATARDGFLAGSDERRLAALQSAFDDPEVDAVWALRGGYGTTRIVDGLDLGRQLRDPIPFVGFSDNTALHARHARIGVVSVHGPHPTAEDSREAGAWLHRVLTRTDPPGALPPDPAGPSPVRLVGGVVEGRLTGGNLALMAALCGTRDALSSEGRILVLEDVGEPPYRLDRMLDQLRRCRVIEGVAGLALGRFSGPPEEDGAALLEVLARWAGVLGVPAVGELPFGHVRHNCALPLGATARLDADAGRLELLEAGVA